MQMAAGRKVKSQEEIVTGSIVAVKASARKEEMSPNVIIGIGLPNEFTVIARGMLVHKETGEAVDSITLSECCLRKRNPNGKFECMGHDVKYFEIMEPPAGQEMERPERYLTFNGPLGEILNLAYYSSEGRQPKVVFRGFGGKGVELDGVLAKQLGSALKEWGLL